MLLWISRVKKPFKLGVDLSKIMKDLEGTAKSIFPKLGDQEQ